MMGDIECHQYGYATATTTTALLPHSRCLLLLFTRLLCASLLCAWCRFEYLTGTSPSRLIVTPPTAKAMYYLASLMSRSHVSYHVNECNPISSALSPHPFHPTGGSGDGFTRA